ncbi:MAG: hypothetical protein LH477_16820 [Nocardioides sp.]|nr:hypothetical protein [Nocardioides sp.]
MIGRRHRVPDPLAYPPGPVRDLAAAPPSPPATAVAAVEFLAVDIETTGLNPRRDHVLAAGWVPVAAGQIVLAEAREVLVRPPTGVDVGHSATVHGLTDDDLARAVPLADMLPQLLAALHGRVLLAHHTPIELRFLRRASRTAYGCGLPLTAVDTVTLQHRLFADAHGAVAPGLLRLHGARSKFGLPRYRAHHALVDAIAAGELLLAQIAELEHVLGREPALSDLSPIRRR